MEPLLGTDAAVAEVCTHYIRHLTAAQPGTFMCFTILRTTALDRVLHKAD